MKLIEFPVDPIWASIQEIERISKINDETMLRASLNFFKTPDDQKSAGDAMSMLMMVNEYEEALRQKEESLASIMSQGE